MSTSSLNPSSADLSAIRSGDDSTFNILLNVWLPIIHQMAYRFSRRVGDREDYFRPGSKQGNK